MKSTLAFVMVLATCQACFAEMSASDILKKVEDRYSGFNTFNAQGETISDMKPAGVKRSNLLTNTFQVKLAKPNLFHVQWSQPYPNGMSNDGIAWGDGMGNFLMTSEEQTCRAMNNLVAALTASGASSGGATLTTPSLFFDITNSTLKKVKDFSLAKDESVEGEDCYHLTGTTSGQIINVWITKKDLFVKRKQFIIGAMPEATDESAKQALKQMNREITPEAIADMKEKLKRSKELMGRMQGTITETYHQIAADKPLRKEDYIQSIPKGVRFLER